MHKEAIAIWEEMTAYQDERFKYLLELDSRYRGAGQIGDGLKTLSRALVRKVEEAKKA